MKTAPPRGVTNISIAPNQRLQAYRAEPYSQTTKAVQRLSSITPADVYNEDEKNPELKFFQIVFILRRHLNAEGFLPI